MAPRDLIDQSCGSVSGEGSENEPYPPQPQRAPPRPPSTSSSPSSPAPNFRNHHHHINTSSPRIALKPSIVHKGHGDTKSLQDTASLHTQRTFSYRPSPSPASGLVSHISLAAILDDQNKTSSTTPKSTPSHESNSDIKTSQEHRSLVTQRSPSPALSDKTIVPDRPHLEAQRVHVMEFLNTQPPNLERSVDFSYHGAVNEHAKNVTDNDHIFWEYLAPREQFTVQQTSQFFNLNAEIKRRIYDFVFPYSGDVFQVTLSPLFADKDSYPGDFFLVPWDVLWAVEGAQYACKQMRDEVMTYFWTQYKFHVVLSAYTQPNTSALTMKWLPMYLDKIQYLAIEADFTKLAFSDQTNAELLQSGRVSWVKHLIKKIAETIAFRKVKYKYPGNFQLNRSMAQLHLKIRRYRGIRPNADPQKVKPFCPELAMFVFDGLVEPLRGIVIECRMSGFSQAYTHIFMRRLFGDNMKKSSITTPAWPAHPQVPGSTLTVNSAFSSNSWAVLSPNPDQPSASLPGSLTDRPAWLAPGEQLFSLMYAYTPDNPQNMGPLRPGDFVVVSEQRTDGWALAENEFGDLSYIPTSFLQDATHLTTPDSKGLATRIIRKLDYMPNSPYPAEDPPHSRWGHTRRVPWESQVPIGGWPKAPKMPARLDSPVESRSLEDGGTFTDSDLTSSGYASSSGYALSSDYASDSMAIVKSPIMSGNSSHFQAESSAPTGLGIRRTSTASTGHFSTSSFSSYGSARADSPTLPSPRPDAHLGTHPAFRRTSSALNTPLLSSPLTSSFLPSQDKDESSKFFADQKNHSTPPLDTGGINLGFGIMAIAKSPPKSPNALNRQNLTDPAFQNAFSALSMTGEKKEDDKKDKTSRKGAKLFGKK